MLKRSDPFVLDQCVELRGCGTEGPLKIKLFISKSFKTYKGLNKVLFTNFQEKLKLKAKLKLLKVFTEKLR